MKVELIDVGWFHVPAGIVCSGEDMDVEMPCPIPAYMIEVGDERILVDVGPHPDAARDAAAHYGNPDGLHPFRLDQEASIADRTDLEAVTQVVMTHLHWDHAGALSLLNPGIPVVVQRREWEAAHDVEAIEANAFIPRDYECLEGRVTTVDGDHDLLGDGSVMLLLTPGHTPGHQSVKVGDSLVLGGDVAHLAATLDDLRFPVFGDHQQQGESANRLRDLRDNGARVLPGHDAEVLRPGAVPVE
jgi:N-acyl homoserine lactone hydrolase